MAIPHHCRGDRLFPGAEYFGRMDPGRSGGVSTSGRRCPDMDTAVFHLPLGALFDGRRPYTHLQGHHQQDAPLGHHTWHGDGMVGVRVGGQDGGTYVPSAIHRCSHHDGMCRTVIPRTGVQPSGHSKLAGIGISGIDVPLSFDQQRRSGNAIGRCHFSHGVFLYRLSPGRRGRSSSAECVDVLQQHAGPDETIQRDRVRIVGFEKHSFVRTQDHHGPAVFPAVPVILSIGIHSVRPGPGDRVGMHLFRAHSILGSKNTVERGKDEPGRVEKVRHCHHRRIRAIGDRGRAPCTKSGRGCGRSRSRSKRKSKSKSKRKRKSSGSTPIVGARVSIPTGGARTQARS